MNLRTLLVTILAALAAQTGDSTSRLPRCADVGVMTAALKEISESDWAQVSATELQSMWSTELAAIDCDADGCKTLRREDRIVNDSANVVRFSTSMSTMMTREPLRGSGYTALYFTTRRIVSKRC
jgi:hypothetical protein